MSYLHFVVFLALSLPFAFPALALDSLPEPSPEELRRVLNDEVVVSHQQVPGSRAIAFTAFGRVSASPERLARYYYDPQTLRKFQTAVRRVEVVAMQPRSMQVRYEVGLPWPLGDRHFVLALRHSPLDHVVSWDLVRGNVKENRGFYAMTPLSDGSTLVRYRIQADLDTWVPPFLLAWVQSGMIPRVITEARREVGSPSHVGGLPQDARGP